MKRITNSTDNIIDKLSKGYNIVKEEVEKDPEKWGTRAALCLFGGALLAHTIKIWKLESDVSRLKLDQEATNISLAFTDGIVDAHRKGITGLNWIMENNDRAFIAQMDFLGDHLGVKEEMHAAGVAASDAFLEMTGVAEENVPNIFKHIEYACRAKKVTF